MGVRVNGVIYLLGGLAGGACVNAPQAMPASPPPNADSLRVVVQAFLRDIRDGAIDRARSRASRQFDVGGFATFLRNHEGRLVAWADSATVIEVLGGASLDRPSSEVSVVFEAAVRSFAAFCYEGRENDRLVFTFKREAGQWKITQVTLPRIC